MRNRIIISCEHAGNYVPLGYQHLFAQESEVLETHRGYDIGALDVAKYMAKQLGIHLHYQKISRLLIESNRSTTHPELYSEYSRGLSAEAKAILQAKYYNPYRTAIEQEINRAKANGSLCIHVSVHSFTPVLNGSERLVDIGLLFDDQRQPEQQFCHDWKPLLAAALPEQVVLYNCPYHGADDGLTTYLRTRFTPEEYLGIEIEINQKYAHTTALQNIRQALTLTLQSLTSSELMKS
ncbi:hypothetical protein BFP72_13075 [Reichenbachiella sp. 5M10]|uniref:N-formylglutamate amidohydrolase n=1 Tax=Reichenbachiella sp. 5M10 TaxID=1889772 RepID=UPI000C15760D|nr:N-formylglutamate amidohydrolase [Reichenbachiella sp. 5M10]PIB36255.1 hypothetical protein BFP72_13075 [Reichenbachiella sp. 5M10]